MTHAHVSLLKNDNTRDDLVEHARRAHGDCEQFRKVRTCVRSREVGRGTGKLHGLPALAALWVELPTTLLSIYLSCAYLSCACEDPFPMAARHYEQQPLCTMPFTEFRDPQKSIDDVFLRMMYRRVQVDQGNGQHATRPLPYCYRRMRPAFAKKGN
jgi:hypothetical protein